MESMKAGAAAVPAVTTVVAVPAVIAAPMPQTISPPTTPPPTAPAATAQPLTLPVCFLETYAPAHPPITAPTIAPIIIHAKVIECPVGSEYVVVSPH